MPKQSDDLEGVITGEVLEIIDTEKKIRVELEALESELSKNPLFHDFIMKQSELKLANEKSSEVWKKIETDMIEHEVKTIKGDWGSLTIAERLSWEYDPSQLQPKFFKKVVDTKKLSDTFRLEGKPPKAATPKYTRYLVRKLK